MRNAIIKTKDLCKTYYENGKGFNAIKNINLEIYENEFTVIMGSSGSGKSTLLYLLSGLDSVTAGEVWFKDELIINYNDKQHSEFRRKSIGFIFQSVNLISDLSIYENVIVAGYLREYNKNKVEKKALNILKMLELEQHLYRYPSQVSGGEKQRAAIARGIINSPQLLFADEPTGSLNSSQGENVLNIMTDLNCNGQTIVMVTHDLKVASRADRILFLKDGRIDDELNLPKYNINNKVEREKIIFSYLTDKGW